MAVSRVFKEFPDLVRIEALVEVENKGSQRVLEKVGFLREGLLRKYGFCKGEIRDIIRSCVLHYKCLVVLSFQSVLLLSDF